MKKGVLFLIAFLLLLSCESRVPNPQMQQLSFNGKKVFTESAEKIFWSADSIPLDSFRLILSVMTGNEYFVEVNGKTKMFRLARGNDTIAFGWDEFIVGSRISVTAGDPRFLDETVSLTIPVTEMHIPKIKECRPVYASLVFDTIHHEYYSDVFDFLDSMQLHLKLRRTGLYQITADSTSFTTLLNAGDTTLSIPWNHFAAGDTLAVTVKDTVHASEAVKIKIPVKKVRIPKLTGLTAAHAKVIIDTAHSLVYSSDFKLLDSLRISMNIRDSGAYLIEMNGVTYRKNFSAGPASIAFGWDQAESEDSIVIRAGEPDYPEEMAETAVAVSKRKLYEDPLMAYTWHLVKADSLFAAEWNIDSGSHVSVESVWKTNRGKGVKVAVLDNGIQPGHEDLYPNVKSAWNAGTESDFIPSGEGYHGTGVAGMIGAAAGNHRGISGIAPECELILVRFDVDGAGDAEIIRAFTYARNQGAQVINCSWGSYNVSEAVAQIIADMHDAGITVVFAGGNLGRNLNNPGYIDESELPSVIGVGSSMEQNDFWDGSDYSDSLEILAPGGSSMPGVVVLDGMGGSAGSDQRGLLNENYRFWHGCSFSAPAVSGAAALLLSENPRLTPDQIREILISSADKVGTSASYNASGFDPRRFYGKLNIQKAVELARTK